MASLLDMKERFYSSTEASKITGCSRRQLQYWRKQGVVVPTVNPGGKGRNVYYTESDLLVLSVMEYLLSLGLNFEISLKVLEILRNKDMWFLDKSWTRKKNNRLMLILSGQEENTIQLTDFDLELAIDKLNEGCAVAPFWRGRIYAKLQNNLQNFFHERNRFDRERKN
ncbi:MAG TPA: MerR family transcriptional regulator [Coleofasciculaceae cyanobacterium]